MAKKPPRKVAFIASFPPKKCGIATFTNDLINNIKQAGGSNFEPLVIAMQGEADCTYSDPVKFEIRKNVKNDYISAADYINFSHVDLISVQHEFGLFGGDAGSHLEFLLRRAKAPIITTMHTVLDEPAESYYKATIKLCELSHKVIVMNERGVELLKDVYGIDEKKIELIPHGIPDLPFVDSSYYKHKFGVESRKTILTFGLLSRNKGIELMLKALPAIIEHEPKILYMILGATHPSVVKNDGEEYRFSLKRMVKELGLTDHVIFHNRFVSDKELHNFLCAADLYVTPYMNREQLTSGTLAFAVGTGKAVISTPYWAAEELLADGRGELISFGDHKQLSEVVIRLLQDDSRFFALRRKAYEYGRDITWPVIGKHYWKMFSSNTLPVRILTRSAAHTEEVMSILEVPEPPLDHLIRMSDDTGLYQHAKFTIPDREHGYCTDDNARSLVAMTKYYAQYAEPESLKLFETYLSFVYHANNRDGTVRNFMTFDRQWIQDEPAHDSLGRTLWAFGTVMSKPPLPRYLPIIKDAFDRTSVHVPKLSMRGKSYSIFGMAEYLTQFPGASEIKRLFAMAADELVDHYERSHGEGWEWFEDIVTYDNAVLPHALYVAFMTTGNEKYLEVAEKTCNFLMENTYDEDHFSFVGCNGWFKRGKKKAQFDQQPLEVACTVMMLQAAYDATSNASYLKLQRKAFDWFLGENDLQIPVYDFRTKGSGDGLEPTGVNLNQGAESLVSFLLSLLCILESYSMRGGAVEEKTLFTEIENRQRQQAIVDVPAKGEAVEEGV